MATLKRKYKTWETEGKKKNLPKIEEISGGKAHTNKWKLIQNISTITDVFLNQKKVNICTHCKDGIMTF